MENTGGGARPSISAFPDSFSPVNVGTSVMMLQNQLVLPFDLSIGPLSLGFLANGEYLIDCDFSLHQATIIKFD